MLMRPAAVPLFCRSPAVAVVVESKTTHIENGWLIVVTVPVIAAVEPLKTMPGWPFSRPDPTVIAPDVEGNATLPMKSVHVPPEKPREAIMVRTDGVGRIVTAFASALLVPAVAVTVTVHCELAVSAGTVNVTEPLDPLTLVPLPEHPDPLRVTAEAPAHPPAVQVRVQLEAPPGAERQGAPAATAMVGAGPESTPPLEDPDDDPELELLDPPEDEEDVANGFIRCPERPPAARHVVGHMT